MSTTIIVLIVIAAIVVIGVVLYLGKRQREAQLLISHPNYTGMQIDQLTRLWIPPDYVQSVKVSYGGTLVLEVEGDIALSEDPAISFSFVPEAPAPMVVQVEDSKGRKFEQSWPIGPAS